jgi:hypothetical protein
MEPVARKAVEEATAKAFAGPVEGGLEEDRRRFG